MSYKHTKTNSLCFVVVNILYIFYFRTSMQTYLWTNINLFIRENKLAVLNIPRYEIQLNVVYQITPIVTTSRP